MPAIAGRTNLSYLPKYFRKVEGERDVLTLCSLRHALCGLFGRANFFMDDVSNFFERIQLTIEDTTPNTGKNLNYLWNVFGVGLVGFRIR